MNNYSTKSLINNSRGMTLVEIMIVVTILAGLMAVLGNQVVSAKKKANVKQAKIQIAEISKALDMYYTDCSKYPTTEEGLAALSPGGEGTCENWGPEAYMRKLPKDPWGNPFEYVLENGQYVITSFGEGGKSGGTGHEKDISNVD